MLITSTVAHPRVHAAPGEPTTETTPRERADDANDGAGALAAEAPAHSLTLGMRGIIGAGFAEDETVTAGGGAVSAALPILRERWELELEFAVIRPDAWVGAIELLVRRSFELDGRWLPHLTLGPLVSLELEGGDAGLALGLAAGGGVSWRLDASWALTLDATYRLLTEDEPLHVLTLAAGVSLRI